MRRSALALCAIAALVAAGATLWPPAPEVVSHGRIVLDNVVLVAPAGPRLAGQQIVIESGRIAAIGPATSRQRERFVLPGLVDMHVHLPPRLVPGLVDLFDLLFLAHGVTAIREVGSLDGSSFEIAREIEQGRRLGPRVLPCGPVVDGDPPGLPGSWVARDAAEGARVVRDLAARGARCVKVYDGVSPEALSAIRETAHGLGLPVVGHLPSALPIDEPALDDVQHLCYTRCGSISPAELEAFIARSAARGVAQTPTLVVFEGLLVASGRSPARPGMEPLMPRFWREALWRPVVPLRNEQILLSMQALVRRLHTAGVAIHAGTDPIQPYVVPGASLWRELALLHEAGLSTEEALASATTVAGASLGVAGLGRIEVGAPADLIVLREDPTCDLAALATLEAVIADGRLYPIETLRAALAEQQRYFDRAVVETALGLAARAAFEVGQQSYTRADSEPAP